MKFLLDSNIISEPLKSTPDPNIMRFLKENDGHYAICAPVLYEIQFGIEQIKDIRKKKKYLDYISFINEYLDILPYDSESAKIHVREQTRLFEQGKKPSFIGGQIASISIRNRLHLVTKNGQQYDSFPVSLVIPSE